MVVLDPLLLHELQHLIGSLLFGRFSSSYSFIVLELPWGPTPLMPFGTFAKAICSIIMGILCSPMLAVLAVLNPAYNICCIPWVFLSQG